jgi:hypothetical protein
MMALLTDTAPGAASAVRHFLNMRPCLSLLFSYFVHLISGYIEPPFERKSEAYGTFFA